MPYTSLFSGFPLACWAGVETIPYNLKKFTFLPGKVKVLFSKALQKLPLGQLACLLVNYSTSTVNRVQPVKKV